jgi:uncharacterized protein (DUF3820 family)
MTKDEALKYEMPFGKYAGMSIADVYRIDERYLQWVFKEFDPRGFRKLREALEALNFEDEE